jgi:hypothetical protein
MIIGILIINSANLLVQ